jgi:hypothetical protein
MFWMVDCNNKTMCRTIAQCTAQNNQQMDLLSREVCILLPDRRTFRNFRVLSDVNNNKSSVSNKKKRDLMFPINASRL